MFGGIRDLTVIPRPSGHRSQTWIVAFMWSSERPKTSDPQFSTRKHLSRCKNLARWPVLKTADSLLGIQVRSLTFFDGRNFRDSYTWLSLTRLLAMFSVEKVLIGTDGIQTRDSVFLCVWGREGIVSCFCSIHSWHINTGLECSCSFVNQCTVSMISGNWRDRHDLAGSMLQMGGYETLW